MMKHWEMLNRNEKWKDFGNVEKNNGEFHLKTNYIYDTFEISNSPNRSLNNIATTLDWKVMPIVWISKRSIDSTIKHVSPFDLKYFENISSMAMADLWYPLDSWHFLSHFAVQTKRCQCSKRKILFLMLLVVVVLKLKYIVTFRKPTKRLWMIILVRNVS